MRYVKAARDAGLRRAVVSSSANCQDVLIAAGIEDLFEARIDGQGRRAAPQGQARARHVPGRGPRARRRARPRGGVRGRAGGRAGGPRGRFGYVVGVDRVGQVTPMRCARMAPASSSRTSPSCSTRRDRAPGLPGRAVGGARDRAGPRQPGADRVGVRPLQRPHRPARQPRRGRALRDPRDLSRRLLRDAPAAVRRGRLRLSGGRPDGGQRHQRQDHPPAGRGRAVRRPLRRPAQPRAGARPARRRAAPHGRVGVADRAAGARALHPAGLVHPARRGSDRVHRRGRRGRVPGGPAVPAGRQRARPERRAATRARPRRWPRPSSQRSTTPSTSARSWSTTPGRAGCGWPPRWTI